MRVQQQRGRVHRACEPCKDIPARAADLLARLVDEYRLRAQFAQLLRDEFAHRRLVLRTALNRCHLHKQPRHPLMIEQRLIRIGVGETPQ
jgi:hypothetical protein